MRYLLACVHSWWWHLTYGMWKGYCELRYFGTVTEYGWQVRGPVVALCSTTTDYRIVKVFWRAPGPWQCNMACAHRRSGSRSGGKVNLKDLMTGITTLQPYYDKPEGYHLSAEHDQIWLHSTNRPLPPEDVQRMIDASWWQERSDYSKDFTVADYDASESWTGYV